MLNQKTPNRSTTQLLLILLAVVGILGVAWTANNSTNRKPASEVTIYRDIDNEDGLVEHQSFFLKKTWKKIKKGVKKVFVGSYKPPTGVPTQPFRLFYVITRTPYQSNQEKFLRDYGYDYITKGNCVTREKWKVCAYKDTRKKLLYISFRGSANINNYLHDIEHVAGTNKLKKLANKFDGDVGNMIKNNKGYFPYMIVGHSAGGYFALRVQKKRAIWRLTLNALDAQNGKYNINFRLKLDPVSVHPFSKVGHYLTVGSGGHKAPEFNKLRNKSWKQLSNKLGKLKVKKLPGCRY